MRAPRLSTLILCAALPACTSWQDVDLRPFLEKPGLPLTQGPAPEGAVPVSFVAAQKDGFYLFGFIPFVRVDLGRCVEALLESAERVEADGVAEIRIGYKPASVLSFTSLGLPDWFAKVTLTGMAYRLPDAARR